MAKKLHNLDYTSVMYPDDKKIIDWLNSLKVPYMTKLDFIRQIARHPTDHNLREWFEIFMAGVEYYTFQDFLRTTTSKYREAYNEVENQGEGINITEESLPQMYHELEKSCDILGIKDIPAYGKDQYYFGNSMEVLWDQITVTDEDAGAVEKFLNWIKNAAVTVVDEGINTEQLKTRFEKEIAEEQAVVKKSEAKLNGNFAQHAPENLIQEERDRLAESQRKIETLKGYLKELM